MASELWCDSLEIREARAGEAARVYAITRSAFLEYASDVPPPSALFENEAEVVGELAEGSHHALLAERDGKALGCVRYELDRRGLHFFRLAVLPSARRQGVAKALLARLEEVARTHEKSRIWCHVRPKVSQNVALYESVGYMRNGEDVMVRNGFVIPVGVMEKWI